VNDNVSALFRKAQSHRSPQPFRAPVTRATCPCNDSPDFLPYSIIFEPETPYRHIPLGQAFLPVLLSSSINFTEDRPGMSVLPYNH